MPPFTIEHVSFGKLYEPREVLTGIANAYLSRIPLDPILAALTIHAILKQVPSAEDLSIPTAGAYIAGIQFKTWDDPKTYFQIHRQAAEKATGKHATNSWFDPLLNVYNDLEQLLALTSLLYFESLMQVFASPVNQTQETALRLLSLVSENKETLAYPLDSELTSSDKANAHITIILYAGRTPYVNSYESESTMQQPIRHFEEAVAILFPQIAVATKLSLSAVPREFFEHALKDEIASWTQHKPQIGQRKDWSWLPEFGSPFAR
jgi:hypothetical protein